MPTAILEARPHRAGATSAVTIDAVVRDEQFFSGRYRLSVSFVRISKGEKLSGEWKSYRQIFVMQNEAETVAAISESASCRLRGRDGRLSRGIRRRSIRILARRTRYEHHRADYSFCDAMFSHSENTNNSPPQLVHLERSGRVVPRSLTSYGRFAATSPAISSPMSPPIPA